MSHLLTRFFSLSTLRTVLIYALILTISGFLGNLWMTRDQASGFMPQIVTQDIAGHSVNLGYPRQPGESLQLPDNLEGKPLLVYFFAEWCPVCKFQNPVISAIQRDYPVIAISMQSGNAANVQRYLSEQDLDFRVVNDEDGRISRQLGVNGVPATFILNQQGRIKYSTRGYTTGPGLRSRLWLSSQS